MNLSHVIDFFDYEYRYIPIKGATLIKAPP